jgi:hypothetical protein
MNLEKRRKEIEARLTEIRSPRRSGIRRCKT